MKLLMALCLQLGLTSICLAVEDVPNLNRVQNNIYRSGRLTERGLQQIRRDFGIRTIVNIEDSMADVNAERKWAQSAGIRYEAIPMSALVPPTDQKVDKILALVNDPSLQPLLIHCHHGEDRTGLIVGLYRVFTQGWTPQDAYEEMLELGFHPALVGLDRYYKRRSGYSYLEVDLNPAM